MQRPRIARGDISARYVGATTAVCPIPRPAMNLPAYTWPILPLEVMKIMIPVIQMRQSCRVAHRRPILSVIRKALECFDALSAGTGAASQYRGIGGTYSKAPPMLPICTIAVIFPRRLAFSDSLRRGSLRRYFEMKAFCWTVPEMRPSSIPGRGEIQSAFSLTTN